jgi:AbrB family looped-hinge helix DNA binding protein
MNLIKEVTIGKKYTIYLPKAIVKALNLKEGNKFLLRISGNTIIMEPIYDPIKLALSEQKFASIKPEEVELISLEEQEKYIKGSS